MRLLEVLERRDRVTEPQRELAERGRAERIARSRPLHGEGIAATGFAVEAEAVRVLLPAGGGGVERRVPRRKPLVQDVDGRAGAVLDRADAEVARERVVAT
jgi:hypothetical protein